MFILENLVWAVVPRVPRATHSRKPRYLLTAMVRVKDEGRFLPEWIAHHILIGVEHFYIYDNASQDGTREILEPFVQAGFVTYNYWDVVPVSPSADLHFQETHADESSWTAYLDADEFIVADESVSLGEVLSSWPHPALAINWRYFGSSFLETVPPGLVTANFKLADASIDRHVKVIARNRAIRRYRNPHNFYYRKGRLARTITGERVVASFARAKRDHAAIEMHHYVYRSRADYERKVRRGFATLRGASDRARRLERVATEFPRHNEVSHETAVVRSNRTASLLREIGFTSPYVDLDSVTPQPDLLDGCCYPVVPEEDR